MTEEEIIKDLEQVIELHEEQCLITTDEDFEAIQGLLDLYDQKKVELEEAKNKIDELENADLSIVHMTGYYDGMDAFKEEICKILNEKEDLPKVRVLSLIKTIVAENSRLEDLEDNTDELKILLKEEKEKNRKLHSQIDEHVYNGCDYEICNKKWENKIKQIIETCKNEKENANRIHYNYWNKFEKILKSVLNENKED